MRFGHLKFSIFRLLLFVFKSKLSCIFFAWQRERSNLCLLLIGYRIVWCIIHWRGENEKSDLLHPSLLDGRCYCWIFPQASGMRELMMFYSWRLQKKVSTGWWLAKLALGRLNVGFVYFFYTHGRVSMNNIRFDVFECILERAVCINRISVCLC